MSQRKDFEEHKPKSWLWRWDEKYKYPMPNPGGDHWDMILERVLAKDRFQCDAWKDEVQNLLIFAGLFSAVVTGFAVESYKNLQPDPNVALIALLSRISTRIDTLTNNSDVGTPFENIQYPASFSPDPSSVHINIFWFASLILSLTTVIVGIVSLQWLREHQRYTEPLTSRQALAVFHLRSASLKRWHVPHIFSALPLVLQAAVILFFVGLVEFLLSLNHTVAIPAILLIGLSILFLVATTVLPALQPSLMNFVSFSNGSIPAQCPYKSPQSWIFRRVFLLLSRGPALIYHLSCQVKRMKKLNSTGIRSFRSLFTLTEPSLLPNPQHSIQTHPDIDAEHKHRNWIDLDIAWLNRRDSYFLSQKGMLIDPKGCNISPTYDLVCALISSARKHSVNDDSLVSAAYHGYKELCDALIHDQDAEPEPNDNPTLESMVQARLSILHSCFAPFQSVYFKRKGVNLRMVRDETLLLFLDSPGVRIHSSRPDHPVGMHKIELVNRLLVYNFHRGSIHVGDAEPDPIYHTIFGREHGEHSWDVPVALREDIVTQHYMSLRHIFEHAQNITLGDAQATSTVVGYPILAKYLEYVGWFRPPERLEPTFKSSVLDSISKGLLFALDSNGYDHADFLFFCARLYMEQLAHNLWFANVMKFGSYTPLRANILDVLQTMLRYEHQLDKAAYARVESVWRAGLYSAHKHSDDVHPHTVHRPMVPSVYQPISESLLRFIPYEGRTSAPVTVVDVSHALYFHDYERVALPGEVCDASLGEGMVFSFSSESDSCRVPVVSF